jgi:hypothetical protein
MILVTGSRFSVRSFYADGNLDESKVLPAVPELTGRPPRTFSQWAAAHADTFR